MSMSRSAQPPATSARRNACATSAVLLPSPCTERSAIVSLDRSSACASAAGKGLGSARAGVAMGASSASAAANPVRCGFMLRVCPTFRLHGNRVRAQGMSGPGIALDRFVRDNPEEAAVRLQAVLADDSRNAEAWRLLGRALRLLGRDEEAAEAEVQSVRATAYEPEMIAIAQAMTGGD